MKPYFIPDRHILLATILCLGGWLAGIIAAPAQETIRQYDITGLLKFGEENLLEVSVSDKSANNSVNGAEHYADFWVFGGIFRPVWLQAEPAQFVDRVAIDARADGSFAMDYYFGGEGQNNIFSPEPAAQSTAPAVLPGNGLARHDFFYAGEAKTRDMYIVRGGRVVWSYHDPSGKGEISDAKTSPL